MKNRHLKIFAVIIAVSLLFCGCNDVIGSPNLMTDVSAGEVSETPLSAPESASLTDFALRLFKAGNEDGENTLISPLSVLAALSMTANGAKGETLAEMEAVLGMPVNRLNGYMHSYMNSLPSGEKYKLSLANSIWFTDDSRFTVNEDFLQTNADYFGADIYRSPFDNSTLKDINLWVEQKTDGMIPEILDEIPEAAVMYLINALAFEAEWMEIYTKDSVSTNTFTTADGTSQQVEFMYSTESGYFEDENATGFIKYYKDRKYAFVALLPNEGITVTEYVNSLDGESLASMLADPINSKVKVSIPKFETEYDTEMSEILFEMGMKKAFNGFEADFSALGTSTAGNIFISRVLHKTFISVGEKGTKAGAATVVEMQDECAPEFEETKKVYLDRPFVYMLIDCENSIPFFIGTLNEIRPAENKLEDNDFDAQYIRTDGYHDNVKYPKVTVITSKDELDEYYNANKDLYFLDHVDKVYSDTTIGFIDACEKYDNEYFEDNILILVLLEEGSGSIRHEVKSVKTSGSNVEIDIEVNIPEECTDDMAEWHIMIEADKDSGIEKGDNIKVNLS
ncbi:MAG: serpin family protein [Clostridia bacterium]|nr:serpin family protein [Clostridia bacterium]